MIADTLAKGVFGVVGLYVFMAGLILGGRAFIGNKINLPIKQRESVNNGEQDISPTERYKGHFCVDRR